VGGKKRGTEKEIEEGNTLKIYIKPIFPLICYLNLETDVRGGGGGVGGGGVGGGLGGSGGGGGGGGDKTMIFSLEGKHSSRLSLTTLSPA